jgi:hypothetical protein
VTDDARNRAELQLLEVTTMSDTPPLPVDREKVATDRAEQAIHQAVSAALWADLAEIPTFSDAKPLSAHYTSIHTLEAILRNKEFWLSNPLYMNDLEEVRFHVQLLTRLVSTDSQISKRRCRAGEREDLGEVYGVTCAQQAIEVVRFAPRKVPTYKLRLDGSPLLR